MEKKEEENEDDRKMSGLGFLPLQSLPLGFRFHPTDEELINHYLKGKIRGRLTSTEAAVIPEVDLRRSEPWDLPELSPIRSADSEWFFFAAIDRKYPNGGRSNRATAAGYWKATGKDRSIKSKNVMVGMKKTLVFHTGRAPKGLRSNWIMHEYRVIDPEPESGDQGGFVLCRLFKKSEERIPSYTDDEIERSDFSATPIQFSPENMLRDAGVLEESATPQNQEFLESDKQPLADATDNQKSGIRSEMTDRTDGSIATLLKPEESHCISNITSDIGDYEANAVAPWLNDFYIRPIPGTDYDYPVLSSVHYVSQEPHHRSQDEMEKQDLIEFSDSLIKDTDSPEVANFETETATEVVPNGQVSLITHGSSRDLVSGKHRDMSNDLDTEAFIAQEGLTREDSGQLIRIPFSSSNSLEMNTSSGCNEIKPEFSIVYENPSPLLKSTGLCNNNWGFKMEIPWSESSLSLNLVGDMEESIDQANTTGSGIMIGQHKHPVNQPASIDYTAQQSTASERPLYINGTGMEIRRRQHSDAASTSSVYPTQQGMAARRTRLQCSTSTEGPTISEDLDSNEDEEEVNLATTKDEEHAKNQIMADWDSCFLQDCYDDTVSMEVNTTCKEMLEGPVPRPIADTEIKLEGSSLNHETSRIWRLSVIAALIIVPLCVGISIFLTA